ncbi:hypothetical protein ACI8AK_05240 [Geodermatophilus sp. SYSU D00867]
MTDERSAALLVRIWLEGGIDRFRARVTEVGLDTSEEDRTLTLTSSPREVVDAVSHWLDHFLRYGTTTD